LFIYNQYTQLFYKIVTLYMIIREQFILITSNFTFHKK